MPIEIYLKPLESTLENLSVNPSEYIYSVADRDSDCFDLSNIQTKSNKIQVVSKFSR